MALAAQEDFSHGESSLHSKEKNQLAYDPSNFGWRVTATGGGWPAGVAPELEPYVGVYAGAQGGIDVRLALGCLVGAYLACLFWIRRPIAVLFP